MSNRKDQKTSQIISSAISEFLHNGLDAASMHRIAEDAEVSKRTLYKYFPTKEELIEAIIDRLMEGFLEMKLPDFSENQPIDQQISKLLDHKVELICAEEYLNITRIVGGELFKGRKLAPRHLEMITKTEAMFLNWLSSGVKLGYIKEDPPVELIASQFHALLKGQIFYPALFGIHHPSKEEIEVARKSTLDFFMNSFVIKKT